MEKVCHRNASMHKLWKQSPLVEQLERISFQNFSFSLTNRFDLGYLCFNDTTDMTFFAMYSLGGMEAIL